MNHNQHNTLELFKEIEYAGLAQELFDLLKERSRKFVDFYELEVCSPGRRSVFYEHSQHGVMNYSKQFEIDLHRVALFLSEDELLELFSDLEFDCVCRNFDAMLAGFVRAGNLDKLAGEYFTFKAWCYYGTGNGAPVLVTQRVVDYNELLSYVTTPPTKSQTMFARLGL